MHTLLLFLMFLLAIAFVVSVLLAIGMRYGRLWTVEDLAAKEDVDALVDASPPVCSIPVSMADYETWVFTDRQEVSMQQYL